MIRRAAKLMAGALRSTLPPPIIQSLVSHPTLVRALLDELAVFVGGETMRVTAGRKQVVFLGNTGPNNAREWVVIQYRNGPNGNGEKVMRVSQRLGLEPRPDQPVQWTDLSFMRTYLKNMRPKLSRPGVMLMNKLAAVAATEVRAVDEDMVYELKLYIENDGQLYRQRTRPVQENLEKKWKKGKYDHAQAPKLWLYLVNDGAKKYVKEHATPDFKIDVATRKQVAQELADEWQVEMEAQLGPMGGAAASTRRVQAAVAPEDVKWLKVKEGDWNTGWGYGIIPLDKNHRAIQPKEFKDKKVQKVLNKSYPYFDEAQDAGQSVFRNAMVSASTRRVQAGTWQEQAKAELEAELGGIETDEGRDSGRDYFTLESSSGRADNGESEWMVFKDAKSAERYAIEYVKDMLDDDPSMFAQKWLKNHVYVSPTDIRIISQEDADSYVDDIKYESEERLLDEAGMQRQWESLEDKKDALNDKMMEEMDPKKEAAFQKQIDKLEQAQSKLVDKADDKLRAELAKRTADALKKDPLAWAEELGFEFDKNRPPWLQIDTRKAAADAVKTDGVAHFLDYYDGEEVELDSGAVAFGTN
jgi:hypothetical protein